MTKRSNKESVVVIGPAGSTGGMASAMRLQLTGPLRDSYHLIPFDNSKRTTQDRSWWHGVGSQLAMIYELMQLLGKHRPEIAHIHTCSPPTFYRSLVDLLVAKLYRSQVVLHVHGGHFAEFLSNLGTVPRWCVRRMLHSADQVVALSSIWAERIREFDPEVKLAVVHNGVVIPKRAKQVRATKKLTLVFVGDLKQAKGIDDLIEALAALPKRSLNRLRLRVIGADPHGRTAELQDLVERLKLCMDVEFVGTLSPKQVQRELFAASCFVLPSYFEGLPIALLEAMACGLPCVASRVGSIPEMIEDGVEGLLVDAGDQEQLSAALKKMLGRIELRRRLGKAARARVRQDYSQATVASTVAQVYDDVLSPSNGTA